MKKYSYKRALQERNLRKIEKELDKDPENIVCFFYHHLLKKEYHHIIPKAHNQELIDCMGNLIPVSMDAHFVLHNGTVKQLRELPAERFREYLSRMERLDQKYYFRFRMRFE